MPTLATCKGLAMLNSIVRFECARLPGTGARQLRSERQRLIASNIANADTPGYIARDMDFAKTLQAATARPCRSTSDAGHEPCRTYRQPAAASLNGGLDGQRADSTPPPAQTSLDRNTVDMDRERASFADNAIKYEATLRFIGQAT